MAKRAAALAAILLAGCATSPRDIAAIPYSDPALAGQSCEQIAQTIATAESELLELMRAQGERRGRDIGFMLVVAPVAPSMFNRDSIEAREARIGELKGQRRALRQEAAGRNCAVPAPPRQFETVFRLGETG